MSTSLTKFFVEQKNKNWNEILDFNYSYEKAVRDEETGEPVGIKTMTASWSKFPFRSLGLKRKDTPAEFKDQVNLFEKRYATLTKAQQQELSENQRQIREVFFLTFQERKSWVWLTMKVESIYEDDILPEFFEKLVLRFLASTDPSGKIGSELPDLFGEAEIPFSFVEKARLVCVPHDFQGEKSCTLEVLIEEEYLPELPLQKFIESTAW